MGFRWVFTSVFIVTVGSVCINVEVRIYSTSVSATSGYALIAALRVYITTRLYHHQAPDDHHSWSTNSSFNHSRAFWPKLLRGHVVAEERI